MTPASREGVRSGPVTDVARLEAALITLRGRIDAADLVLECSGVADARTERAQLLGQIDDYLLPRLRRQHAPILVAVAGSTGAGKSTMVNSVVGARVSATGVRRPTTNSPVLASHPEDADWFAENKFLPTLPRVRQEGLARPGRDGLLVLAATPGLPQGVALLDTPDIDSVVKAHHEFAHKFLDAADVWLFMTTAARYADAPVWALLRQARELDAALGVVLSRVPREGGTDVEEHFTAMLEANGLGDVDRFVIPETRIEDGRLPAEVIDGIRAWLDGLAGDVERREAAISRTLGGVLDSFRTRVPRLAKQVEVQVQLRAELRGVVEGAYSTALAELDEATRNGSLLRGEVLARWNDFTATGDLLRTLAVRGQRGDRDRGDRGDRGDRPKEHKRRAPLRMRALKIALRAGVEALISSAADRAADDAMSRLTAHPAGPGLVHEGVVRGLDPSALGQASPELAGRAGRAVSAWQDHVVRLVASEGVAKRTVAKVATFDDETLAVVLMVGLFGYGASEVPIAEGTSAVPQRLLKGVLGAESLRGIGAKARADLRARIGMLFDEESLRFGQLLDAAGVPDEGAAVQLYQATYTLEVAR